VFELAALCCITKILYVDLLAQGGPHGEVSRSGKKILLGRLVVRPQQYRVRQTGKEEGREGWKQKRPCNKERSWMHRMPARKVELTVCEIQRVRGSIGNLKCCSLFSNTEVITTLRPGFPGSSVFPTHPPSVKG